MSKKDSGSLTYLQKPMPRGARKSRLARSSWAGLNLRNTVDSGMLSKAINVSVCKYPHITPTSKAIAEINNGYDKPLGLFGFDDFLIIVYVSGGIVHIDKIEQVEGQYNVTGYGESPSNDYESQRCIVQFNVFPPDADILDGSYDRRLVIFPDKLSVSCDSEFTLQSIETDGNAVPNIKYACVHLSRLFGVDDSRVYASGFNDYTNWNVDTADDHNEANAWFSASQSNSKADGVFTGITAFQNHVVCFKKDFMHEIYNTKNPFRIQDIYAEGALANSTICDVDGKLIFCSEDAVKVYTGGNPRIISYALGIDRFKNPVAGTDGRNYYLYCLDEEGTDRLFIYDTYVEQWSEQAIDNKIISFAKCDLGFFALLSDGSILKLDTDRYNGVEWIFETDLMTASSLDIKHIDKLSLSCNIADGASMQIYIEDSKGKDKLIWESCGKEGYTVARAKIRSTAYDGFKIRVKGTGFIEIMSMELYIKTGGELYV